MLTRLTIINFYYSLKYSFMPLPNRYDKQNAPLYLFSVVYFRFAENSSVSNKSKWYWIFPSKENEDLSVKAKSRFSISLRSLSQPMSLGEIARTWDVCARTVISEHAQQSGGGSFSSKYGTWENCLTTWWSLPFHANKHPFSCLFISQIAIFTAA